MRDSVSAYKTAINKGRREGEAKGLTLEFISEMTGLSPEEIASL